MLITDRHPAAMNSHVINHFHQKKKNHGLVYVSNDRMGNSLRFEMSLRQWDQQVDRLSETALLIGPVECDGEIFFRAKLCISNSQLEVLFSLGKPSGPVICWECRQTDSWKEPAPELLVTSY